MSNSSLKTAFEEGWGECKDNRYLSAALSTVKRNENETLEDFNRKFNQIVHKLHNDIKPPEATILIYYLDAFDCELGFQTWKKDPQNIKAAQYAAMKIEKNMTASGKENFPSFSKAISSRAEPKPRAMNTIGPTLI